MTKNILITGITGQDGIFLTYTYLKKYKNKRLKIYGTTRTKDQSFFKKLYSLGIKNSNIEISLINLDLTNREEVNNFLKKNKPEKIFNLSGPSSVYDSIAKNSNSKEIIELMFNNLIHGLKNLNYRPFLFQPASSEMFADSGGIPLNEKSKLLPRSPYAVAKYNNFKKMQDLRSYVNMDLCNGIMFNHESEFRERGYLFPKIIIGANNIFNKHINCIELGSLELKRDWSFAGDIAHGIYLLAEQKINEDIILGSGENNSIADLVDKVFSHHKLNFKNHIVINKKLLREEDPVTIISDPRKIKKLTNWQPELNFEELIDRLIFKIKQ